MTMHTYFEGLFAATIVNSTVPSEVAAFLDPERTLTERQANDAAALARYLLADYELQLAAAMGNDKQRDKAHKRLAQLEGAVPPRIDAHDRVQLKIELESAVSVSTSSARRVRDFLESQSRRWVANGGTAQHQESA